MNISDIKLICIKCKTTGRYTVYSDQLTGLIVEVDKLEDAPEEMAKLFKVMLKHGFKKGIHEVYEIQQDEFDKEYGFILKYGIDTVESYNRIKKFWFDNIHKDDPTTQQTR